MRVVGRSLAALSVVLLAATLTGVHVADASGRPTGSPAIIKLYAVGVTHMHTLPGYVETDRGQYYFGYSGSNWRLDADSANPPFPYEHAVNLVATLAIKAGKVSWQLDQFECPVAGGCGSSGSLVIYGTSHGVYYGTTSGANVLPTCWTRASGETEWMVKGYSPGWVPWSVTTGQGFTPEHYVSMTRHGSRELFTSTYTATSSGTHFTEVDTLMTTSHDFVASTDRASATAGHAAYHYTFTYTVLSAGPTPPSLTLCSVTP